MTFLKKRKLKKQIKEYLSAARHAEHMRSDIADPKDLEALAEAKEQLIHIKKTGDGDIGNALEQLLKQINNVYPIKNTTGTRENVEVIIVALAAAMAIRAFFFQPFQIPTGSMQPTLNGITTEVQDGSTFTDHQPIRFFKWLLTGASYKEIKAEASGHPYFKKKLTDRDAYYLEINGILHRIPDYMREAVLRQKEGNGTLCYKNYFKKGDRIVGAKVITGDHILVNKMKYNFMKPQRGDIAVFDTRSIHHEQVRRDTFYIKRMIGLPNETVQIKDREILINGKIIHNPPIFKKMVTDPHYAGHSSAGRLSTPDQKIKLGSDEYLMMGDNTEHSLDGRYFGAVPYRDFQGNAFFVYWPFRSHWGFIH